MDSPSCTLKHTREIESKSNVTRSHFTDDCSRLSLFSKEANNNLNVVKLTGKHCTETISKKGANPSIHLLSCHRKSTVRITCEGNLHEPNFRKKLNKIISRLKILVSNEKRPIKVTKVEPWNSVRVTFNLSNDAAQRLRQLAEHGDENLRDLGILSVQLEGQQVISLRLNNNQNNANGSEQSVAINNNNNNNNSQICNIDQVNDNNGNNIINNNSLEFGNSSTNSKSNELKEQISLTTTLSTETSNSIIDTDSRYHSKYGPINGDISEEFDDNANSNLVDKSRQECTLSINHDSGQRTDVEMAVLQSSTTTTTNSTIATKSQQTQAFHSQQSTSLLTHSNEPVLDENNSTKLSVKSFAPPLPPPTPTSLLSPSSASSSTSVVENFVSGTTAISNSSNDGAHVHLKRSDSATTVSTTLSNAKLSSLNVTMMRNNISNVAQVMVQSDRIQQQQQQQFSNVDNGNESHPPQINSGMGHFNRPRITTSNTSNIISQTTNTVPKISNMQSSLIERQMVSIQHQIDHSNYVNSPSSSSKCTNSSLGHHQHNHHNLNQLITTTNSGNPLRANESTVSPEQKPTPDHSSSSLSSASTLQSNYSMNQQIDSQTLSQSISNNSNNTNNSSDILGSSADAVDDDDLLASVAATGANSIDFNITDLNELNLLSMLEEIEESASQKSTEPTVSDGGNQQMSTMVNKLDESNVRMDETPSSSLQTTNLANTSNMDPVNVATTTATNVKVEPEFQSPNVMAPRTSQALSILAQIGQHHQSVKISNNTSTVLPTSGGQPILINSSTGAVLSQTQPFIQSSSSGMTATTSLASTLYPFTSMQHASLTQFSANVNNNKSQLSSQANSMVPSSSRHVIVPVRQIPAVRAVASQQITQSANPQQQQPPPPPQQQTLYRPINQIVCQSSLPSNVSNNNVGMITNKPQTSQQQQQQQQQLTQQLLIRQGVPFSTAQPTNSSGQQQNPVALSSPLLVNLLQSEMQPSTSLHQNLQHQSFTVGQPGGGTQQIRLIAPNGTQSDGTPLMMMVRVSQGNTQLINTTMGTIVATMPTSHISNSTHEQQHSQQHQFNTNVSIRKEPEQVNEQPPKPKKQRKSRSKQAIAERAAAKAAAEAEASASIAAASSTTNTSVQQVNYSLTSNAITSIPISIAGNNRLQSASPNATINLANFPNSSMAQTIKLQSGTKPQQTTTSLSGQHLFNQKQRVQPVVMITTTNGTNLLSTSDGNVVQTSSGGTFFIANVPSGNLNCNTSVTSTSTTTTAGVQLAGNRKQIFLATKSNSFPVSSALSSGAIVARLSSPVASSSQSLSSSLPSPLSSPLKFLTSTATGSSNSVPISIALTSNSSLLSNADNSKTSSLGNISSPSNNTNAPSTTVDSSLPPTSTNMVSLSSLPTSSSMALLNVTTIGKTPLSSIFTSRISSSSENILSTSKSFNISQASSITNVSSTVTSMISTQLQPQIVSNKFGLSTNQSILATSPKTITSTAYQFTNKSSLKTISVPVSSFQTMQKQVLPIKVSDLNTTTTNIGIVANCNPSNSTTSNDISQFVTKNIETETIGNLINDSQKEELKPSPAPSNQSTNLENYLSSSCNDDTESADRNDLGKDSIVSLNSFDDVLESGDGSGGSKLDINSMFSSNLPNEDESGRMSDFSAPISPSYFLAPASAFENKQQQQQNNQNTKNDNPTNTSVTSDAKKSAKSIDLNRNTPPSVTNSHTEPTATTTTAIMAKVEADPTACISITNTTTTTTTTVTSKSSTSFNFFRSKINFSQDLPDHILDDDDDGDENDGDDFGLLNSPFLSGSIGTISGNSNLTSGISLLPSTTSSECNTSNQANISLSIDEGNFCESPTLSLQSNDNKIDESFDAKMETEQQPQIIATKKEESSNSSSVSSQSTELVQTAHATMNGDLVDPKVFNSHLDSSNSKCLEEEDKTSSILPIKVETQNIPQKSQPIILSDKVNKTIPNKSANAVPKPKKSSNTTKSTASSGKGRTNRKTQVAKNEIANKSELHSLLASPTIKPANIPSLLVSDTSSIVSSTSTTSSSSNDSSSQMSTSRPVLVAFTPTNQISPNPNQQMDNLTQSTVSLSSTSTSGNTTSGTTTFVKVFMPGGTNASKILTLASGANFVTANTSGTQLASAQQQQQQQQQTQSNSGQTIVSSQGSSMTTSTNPNAMYGRYIVNTDGNQITPLFVMKSLMMNNSVMDNQGTNLTSNNGNQIVGQQLKIIGSTVGGSQPLLMVSGATAQQLLSVKSANVAEQTTSNELVEIDPKPVGKKTTKSSTKKTHVPVSVSSSSSSSFGCNESTVSNESSSSSVLDIDSESNKTQTNLIDTTQTKPENSSSVVDSNSQLSQQVTTSDEVTLQEGNSESKQKEDSTNLNVENVVNSTESGNATSVQIMLPKTTLSSNDSHQSGNTLIINSAANNTTTTSTANVVFHADSSKIKDNKLNKNVTISQVVPKSSANPLTTGKRPIMTPKSITFTQTNQTSLQTASSSDLSVPSVFATKSATATITATKTLPTILRQSKRKTETYPSNTPNSSFDLQQQTPGGPIEISGESNEQMIVDNSISLIGSICHSPNKNLNRQLIMPNMIELVDEPTSEIGDVGQVVMPQPRKRARKSKVTTMQQPAALNELGTSLLLNEFNEIDLTNDDTDDSKRPSNSTASPRVLRKTPTISKQFQTPVNAVPAVNKRTPRKNPTTIPNISVHYVPGESTTSTNVFTSSNDAAVLSIAGTLKTDKARKGREMTSNSARQTRSNRSRVQTPGPLENQTTTPTPEIVITDNAVVDSMVINQANIEMVQMPLIDSHLQLTENIGIHVPQVTSPNAMANYLSVDDINPLQSSTIIEQQSNRAPTPSSTIVTTLPTVTPTLTIIESGNSNSSTASSSSSSNSLLMKRPRKSLHSPPTKPSLRSNSVTEPQNQIQPNKRRRITKTETK